MPFQSRVNFEKFQAHLLDTAEARAALAQLVIPHECECCHGKGSMRIHGWYRRNAIDPYEEKTYLLLVPLFICTHCGHSIRALPYELHPWCQYLSKAVRKAVESKLRDGIWHSDVRPYKRLVRKWHSSFMLRVENCATLARGDPLKALEMVPDFTILFRRTTRCEKEIGHPPYFPGNQRTVILSVFQPSVLPCPQTIFKE